MTRPELVDAIIAEMDRVWVQRDSRVLVPNMSGWPRRTASRKKTTFSGRWFYRMTWTSCLSRILKPKSLRRSSLMGVR